MSGSNVVDIFTKLAQRIEPKPKTKLVKRWAIMLGSGELGRNRFYVRTIAAKIVKRAQRRGIDVYMVAAMIRVQA